MPVSSNEAEELVKMCEAVLDYQHQGVTKSALAALFGVEEDSDAFFAGLSAIAMRFRRFNEMIAHAPMSDAHKTRAKTATASLSRFYQTPYMNSSWRDIAKQTITRTELETIFMLGPALYSIAPVSVLSDDEREAFVERLRASIAELEAASDVIADMVKASLQTAVRMIERFDLFGSVALSEQLFVTHAVTSQAATIAPTSRSKGVYAKTAAAVAAVLFTVTQFDGVLSAVENHYTRSQHVIHLLTTTTQKLLAPPTDEQPTGGPAKKTGRVKPQTKSATAELDDA